MSKYLKNLRYLTKNTSYFSCGAVLVSGCFAGAVCAAPTIKQTPVEFEADDLEYSEKGETLTAKGNVLLNQENTLLRADTVSYDKKNDTAKASGNTVLISDNGTLLFADNMETSDGLNKAKAEKLHIMLPNGAKISGDEAEYTKDKGIIMKKASYTPCNICEGMKALWSANATSFEKNDETEMVTYYNAWLDFKGVPFIYTPYLSHPSPEVKRKTGLLLPSFMSNDYLGPSINVPLFINVDEHQNLLFTPMITSKQGTLFNWGYEGRYDKGLLNLTAGITTMDEYKNMRGYLKSDFEYDINTDWRFKGQVNYTSDTSFLRNYSIGNYNIPWLESNATLERFSGKHYLAVGGTYFQELRYDVSHDFSPIVAPDLYYSYMGNPTDSGGYFTFESYSAAVSRGSDYEKLHLAKNVQKINTLSAWHIPYIGKYGSIYNFEASLRLDGYLVNDYYKNKDNPDYNGIKARVFPMLSAEWRYPLIQTNENSYQLLEPIVSAVLSPKGCNPKEIPNEDSLDFNFDDINLFVRNRYVGYDRVESGSRLNYGINWKVYGNDLGNFSAFAGQTYSFTENDSFLASAGLNEHLSDYVGKLGMNLTKYNVDVNYHFRLDKNNMSVHKSEFNVAFGPSWLRLSGYYMDVKEIKTEYSHIAARKEIGLTFDTKLNKYWTARGWWTYNLEKDRGPIEWGLSALYDDECFGLQLGIKREYSENINASDGTTVMLLVNFKTIGSIGY